MKYDFFLEKKKLEKKKYFYLLFCIIQYKKSKILILTIKYVICANM